MSKIVTRFAPSPTGYIHLGNIRSAIYPYLMAKQVKNGRFLLRIEDTDQTRFVPGATELILKTLRWLDLEWDEGPEVGGPETTYFQSERCEIYQKWGEKLLAIGRAYADPTPSEQITKYREACTKDKVPFLYRNFRPTNTPKWRKGLPLRFKAQPKNYTWHDEVMGNLHAGPEVQDDIILIKADGLPTYNFAHLVDDYLMNVTHITRGVEYISSTANYLALYEALDITPPKFVSLPHILAPTGNKKLSKRDGAKSVTDYRDLGVLPEAMLNYLACLGWNDGTEQEIYTREELLKAFSVDRIQNSGARFDETKLLWVNGQWIRKIFDEQGIDALYAKTTGFWPDTAKNYPESYLKAVLAIIYDRLKTLSDLKTMTTYFFTDPRIDLNLIYQNKFLQGVSETGLATLLEQSAQQISEITPDKWQADTIQDTLNQLLIDTDKKPAELFSLLRLALSFAPFSPALNLTMSVLGRNTTLARLRATASSIRKN